MFAFVAALQHDPQDLRDTLGIAKLSFTMMIMIIHCGRSKTQFLTGITDDIEKQKPRTTRHRYRWRPGRGQVG